MSGPPLRRRPVAKFNRINLYALNRFLLGAACGTLMSRYPHPAQEVIFVNVLELARLGAHHARNAVAEEIYLRTGRCMTVPVSIYGEVIERCNYKCRYCEYWRRPHYRDDMPIDDWKKALLDLKDFIGHYHIEFAGGEPYIKKGFVELLTFCGEQDLKWGVTTNGAAFSNEKVGDWTVAAKPFNINISIDSNDAKIHDYSRGIDGSLESIVAGIGNIARARSKYGLDFPIIIKAVVHKLNFRQLPELVDWVRDIGATAINLQPVEQHTEEAKDEFWIGPDELDDLIVVKDRLLEMKRAGAPILNTDLLLNLWPNHFRREKAPREVMPCRVGMRRQSHRPPAQRRCRRRRPCRTGWPLRRAADWTVESM